MRFFHWDRRRCCETLAAKALQACRPSSLTAARPKFMLSSTRPEASESQPGPAAVTLERPRNDAGSSGHAFTGASSEATYLTALLDARRPGFALPGAFFHDERVYAADLEFIFARHWLFLTSQAEIPEAGDYRTYQIGPYSIFILRRDDGSIAAFHNVCRHRGSRILQQPAGVLGANIVCPYHRWTYDPSGSVIDCGPGADLERGRHLSLRPVHLREL